VPGNRPDLPLGAGHEKFRQQTGFSWLTVFKQRQSLRALLRTSREAGFRLERREAGLSRIGDYAAIELVPSSNCLRRPFALSPLTLPSPYA
jgi:hypothetical protein